LAGIHALVETSQDEGTGGERTAEVSGKGAQSDRDLRDPNQVGIPMKSISIPL
jgi:hypothetical protein